MKQAIVDKLAIETYFPYYAEHVNDPEVKTAVMVIVNEEHARGLNLVQTSRGIRTRVSEYLQSRIPVVDPKMIPTAVARQMREQVESHHNHQTAHFQAIWQVTDELVRNAGVDVVFKGGST